MLLVRFSTLNIYWHVYTGDWIWMEHRKKRNRILQKFFHSVLDDVGQRFINGFHYFVILLSRSHSCSLVHKASIRHFLFYKFFILFIISTRDWILNEIALCCPFQCQELIILIYFQTFIWLILFGCANGLFHESLKTEQPNNNIFSASWFKEHTTIHYFKRKCQPSQFPDVNS